MNIEILGIAAALVLLGIIPAMLAKSNGRDYVKWWIYGTLLFPIALPHALYITFIENRKRCGYCRANVRLNAAHCPVCGYEFPDLRP